MKLEEELKLLIPLLTMVRNIHYYIVCDKCLSFKVFNVIASCICLEMNFRPVKPRNSVPT